MGVYGLNDLTDENKAKLFNYVEDNHVEAIIKHIPEDLELSKAKAREYALGLITMQKGKVKLETLDKIKDMDPKKAHELLLCALVKDIDISDKLELSVEEIRNLRQDAYGVVEPVVEPISTPIVEDEKEEIKEESQPLESSEIENAVLSQTKTVVEEEPQQVEQSSTIENEVLSESYEPQDTSNEKHEEENEQEFEDFELGALSSLFSIDR